MMKWTETEDGQYGFIHGVNASTYLWHGRLWACKFFRILLEYSQMYPEPQCNTPLVGRGLSSHDFFDVVISPRNQFLLS